MTLGRGRAARYSCGQGSQRSRGCARREGSCISQTTVMRTYVPSVSEMSVRRVWQPSRRRPLLFQRPSKSPSHSGLEASTPSARYTNQTCCYRSPCPDLSASHSASCVALAMQQVKCQHALREVAKGFRWRWLAAFEKLERRATAGAPWSSEADDLRGHWVEVAQRRRGDRVGSVHVCCEG